MNKRELWIIAWVELVESVITILTLGFIDPRWSFNLVIALSLRKAR